jgi:hypothetical protein
MFIATIANKIPSSVRSAMLTFRPYGTGIFFAIRYYKHFVPTGLFQMRSRLSRLARLSGLARLSRLD